jgi:hypothetical protein
VWVLGHPPTVWVADWDKLQVEYVPAWFPPAEDIHWASENHSEAPCRYQDTWAPLRPWTLPIAVAARAVKERHETIWLEKRETDYRRILSRKPFVQIRLLLYLSLDSLLPAVCPLPAGNFRQWRGHSAGVFRANFSQKYLPPRITVLHHMAS